MKELIEFIQIEEVVEAFKRLKEAFLTKPILLIFNLEKEGRVETDTLDYTIGAILSQKSKSRKQQLTIYYSRKLLLVELNYNIYNKELLVIVKVLCEQRVYLEGVKH